jgi:hypothetical protein
VVKESSIGESDKITRVVTHLGNILQAGDLVLGYDLAHATATGTVDELDSLPYACPDVILVRKTYPLTTHASTTKKKPTGSGRTLPHRRKDAVKKDDDLDFDEKDEMMEVAESLVEDGVIEDADAHWLDARGKEYEIYRQQLHDETELSAEMLIKSTQAKLSERESSQ